MTSDGVLIAATSSRSGKTTVTLGLARALKNRGHDVRVAKSGPDYIDPVYHAIASGHPCVNLDGWAMSDARIAQLASVDDFLIVEGAMGLFDGSMDGRGASAAIARKLSLPIVLVVDCTALAQSVAPIVKGFLSHDPSLSFAGLILNRVGSDRHLAMLEDALSGVDCPVIGVVRRNAALERPSRHLGLVQASEHRDVDAFIETAASVVAESVDLGAITRATGLRAMHGATRRVPPLGKHIAIARDAAFSFIYPHLLADWSAGGAEISYFSPLADEAPEPGSDAIYLPGGYPELHAPALTRAGLFKKAMRQAADDGKTIYGECGGYMVLGKAISDAKNVPHPMLGLLDLETSFAARKLHLGYVDLFASTGPLAGEWKGHEFHYASTTREAGEPLFLSKTSGSAKTQPMGLVSGSVSGSFAHIIDLA